jgi:hypothetical protein
LKIICHFASALKSAKPVANASLRHLPIRFSELANGEGKVNVYNFAPKLHKKACRLLNYEI